VCIGSLAQRSGQHNQEINSRIIVMDSKNERQGNPDPGGFRPVREGEEKRMGTRDMGKRRRGGRTGKRWEV
jgi:ribosomal protein S16